MPDGHRLRRPCICRAILIYGTMKDSLADIVLLPQILPPILPFLEVLNIHLNYLPSECHLQFQKRR